MDSDEKTKTGSFTVDAETGADIDMPSVTRLLNRKTLKLKKADQKPISSHTPTPIVPSIPEPAPPQEALPLEVPPAFDQAPAEIVLELQNSPQTLSQPPEPKQSTSVVAPSPKTTAPPRIKQSARKAQPALTPLNVWDLEKIKNGQDPLGRGIAHLLQRGASSVLYLAIAPGSKGSPVPHFQATAAVNPGNRLKLWTGLKWDPTIVPEVWNSFVKSGQIELSPPATMTNQFSNRNVIRTGFGVQYSEWILILRVGPPQACRGIIAVISSQSILSQLPDALPFITAPVAIQK